MHIKIAHFGKHFGEEPPISGEKGSGTIFFSGCNLHCQFCQNWQISQSFCGKDYTIDDLSAIMLELQNDGAHNINLVTPTIWIKQIKEAIVKAKAQGLNIPIVYNTNGYENIEDLKSLRGLIDIYLPDFKYSDNSLAEKYSKIKNYKEVATNCILEMLSQVGDLILDDNDIAKRGVIIRHLILPNNIQNTLDSLRIIREFSKDITLSLMTQYEPLYNSAKFPEINRPISKEEYNLASDLMDELNFENGWIQPLEEKANKNLIPDFNKEKPFE